MLNYKTIEIVKAAERLVRQCETRDPYKIARQLDIEIIHLNFNKQKGAYKVIKKNRFIFVKNNLQPVFKKIVVLHELGHDELHRDEAIKVGGLQEFNIFDMRDNRMEYEANIFASHISLPDDDFLELVERGYDNQQIACALHSDINLVGLKADILIAKGYRLRPLEHSNDFLKYNK